MGAKVLTGLEHFCDGAWKKFRGLRIGLLCNQASVDSRLRPSKRILASLFPGNLVALFTPQHGYGAEEQDNMKETPHGFDSQLGIPVFSLYSDTRDLTQEMSELIDVLIVDLQDVGCRVYTFGATLLNCLRAAHKYHTKVIVLDRPNPLGGAIVEGNLLTRELFSFVGPYSLPMRHGLTLGEMALMFKDAFKLDCDLQIIRMKGWNRNMIWDDTGLPWVMPSPNMPSQQTSYVYPGQVIWEGTNVSEGRGTCRPFEIFGAPFIDPGKVLKKVEVDTMAGCLIMQFRFRPTFNKWSGKICSGFFIHVSDPRTYRPYRTSLSFLKVILNQYRDAFEWKEPPYEYVNNRRPIELIVGDQLVIKWLEEGEEIRGIEAAWLPSLDRYLKFRKDYLIY